MAVWWTLWTQTDLHGLPRATRSSFPAFAAWQQNPMAVTEECRTVSLHMAIWPSGYFFVQRRVQSVNFSVPGAGALQGSLAEDSVIDSPMKNVPASVRSPFLSTSTRPKFSHLVRGIISGGWLSGKSGAGSFRLTCNR